MDDIMARPSPHNRGLMFAASVLLAAGGYFLAAGSLLEVFSYGSLNWPGIFAVPALTAQFIAWVVLGAALSGHSGGTPKPAARVRRLMIGAYVASLVGFVVGLAILPVTYPRSWSFLVSFLAFPYAPPVHIPVVASLAALFLVASGPVQDPSARDSIQLGCVVAFTAVPIGIVGSALDALLLMTALPVTAVGFSLVALGWRRQL